MWLTSNKLYHTQRYWFEAKSIEFKWICLKIGYPNIPWSPVADHVVPTNLMLFEGIPGMTEIPEASALKPLADAEILKVKPEIQTKNHELPVRHGPANRSFDRFCGRLWGVWWNHHDDSVLSNFWFIYRISGCVLLVKISWNLLSIQKQISSYDMQDMNVSCCGFAFSGSKLGTQSLDA